MYSTRESIHLALFWTRTRVRTLLKWLVSLFRSACPPIDWNIVAVYAFNDEGRFMDVTTMFDPARKDWDQAVSQYTGWPISKVEVRYVSRVGTKYRMVLRPGDSCPFPPSLTCARGKGFLSATIVPDSGIPGAKPVDVTARLRKYAGPLRDFHAHSGCSVRASDVLPMDDWDYVTQRFKKLVVTDLHFKRHVFLLGSDPEIRLDDEKIQ